MMPMPRMDRVASGRKNGSSRVELFLRLAILLRSGALLLFGQGKCIQANLSRAGR